MTILAASSALLYCRTCSTTASARCHVGASFIAARSLASSARQVLNPRKLRYLANQEIRPPSARSNAGVRNSLQDELLGILSLSHVHNVTHRRGSSGVCLLRAIHTVSIRGNCTVRAIASPDAGEVPAEPTLCLPPEPVDNLPPPLRSACAAAKTSEYIHCVYVYNRHHTVSHRASPQVRPSIRQVGRDDKTVQIQGRIWSARHDRGRDRT